MNRTVMVFAVLGLACGGRAGGRADAGCAANTFDACEYPEASVGAPTKQTVSVTEPVSGRVLPVLVRRPPGAGPFPVVVWSHGGGLNDTGHLLSAEWGDTLARHGFMVLSIAHVSMSQPQGALLCAQAQVPAAECVAPADEEANGFIALIKSRDMFAVLEALPTLQLSGTPDLNRVAVGGWSAGARGPQVMHGATFMPSPGAPIYSAAHTRPKAVVALSPISPGYGGFYDTATDSSWKSTRGAVLVATGNNDTKPSKPDLTGAQRRIAYERQPADGTRWLLYSRLPEGVGGHPTYNLEDVGSSDARLSRLSRALRSSVLAFLDAELKGDATARAWLDSDAARTLAGDADWEHK